MHGAYYVTDGSNVTDYWVTSTIEPVKRGPCSLTTAVDRPGAANGLTTVSHGRRPLVDTIVNLRTDTYASREFGTLRSNLDLAVTDGLRGRVRPSRALAVFRSARGLRKESPRRGVLGGRTMGVPKTVSARPGPVPMHARL